MLAFNRTPTSPEGFVLFLAACAGYLLVIRRRDLKPNHVFAVIAMLMVVAVIIPPRSSRDMQAYAAYGSMLVHEHASPYRHTPAEFPADPWVRRMDPTWKGTRSVYGPAFTAMSSAVMASTGRSWLATRLLFQMLAALAVAAALAVIWRRTRDARAVAFVGLHPAIVIHLINGGHNDALVGLGLLAGVLLALDKKYRAAGACIAGAALVKIVALLAAAGLLVWLWRKHSARAAGVAASTIGALVGIGYAIVGPFSALGALRAASRLVSAASVWNWPKWFMRQGGISRGLDPERAGELAGAQLAPWAAVLVLVVAAVLLVTHLHARQPALVPAAALAGYLFAAAYSLPWYVGWALPLLALALDSRLTKLVGVFGLFMAFAYWPRLSPNAGTLPVVLRAISKAGPEIMQGVVLVTLAVFAVQRLKTMRQERLERVSGVAGVETVHVELAYAEGSQG